MASFQWDGLLDSAIKFAIDIAKNQVKDVVGNAAEALKSSVASKWKKINWVDARDAYRGGLLEILSTTKILGNPKPIRIDDIYTDVYVFDRLSALRRFASSLGEINQSDDKLLQDSERLSAIDIVEEGESLFILGRPGAGKTTFLKHLAISACKGELKKTPVFISLKEWSDSGLSIIPFVTRQFDQCGFPDAECFVRALLDSGDALILLDGLDEVNERDNKRNETIKEITNLSYKYRKCQYCLTCRTASTTYSFERFKYVEVADFSPEQQVRFVTQWYGSDSEHLARFLEGWSQSEQSRLRELGKTPLLLTLLCLAFEETLVFPARQVDLYKEAIDALLRKWDTSRLISRDDFYKQLSFSRRENLLEVVAATFYFDSKTAFSKREVEWAILDYLHRLPDKERSGEDDAATVLRQIEAQHGLIVERAAGIFSFSHLTVQEYFTAAYIVKSQDEKLLDRVVEVALQDQKWREVVLYTVGLLPSADSVLAKMALRLKELRGSDPGVIRFLGYCLCTAHLQSRRRGGAQTLIGGTSVTVIKTKIEKYVAARTHPPLTVAETELIAESFLKIRAFLRAREKKYNFGMASGIIKAATDLITKQPSQAASILGGYFSRPDQFISYLYACRLMIECLEVAVARERMSYIESIMSISEKEILRVVEIPGRSS
jgi:hypothetical protein